MYNEENDGQNFLQKQETKRWPSAEQIRRTGKLKVPKNKHDLEVEDAHDNKDITGLSEGEGDHSKDYIMVA